MAIICTAVRKNSDFGEKRMNNYYLSEHIALLERVFSFAYQHKYALKVVEKEVSYSSFFQSIEKRDYFSAFIDDGSLIKNIFHVSNFDLMQTPTYNQCLWAAEAYLRIQEKTKLTFEAIFLYIPISKMYDYFPLFHEMDFIQIVDEFKRLYFNQSVLNILLTSYNYSLKYVSEILSLPYDSLYSYKTRRRDIKKISGEASYLLASLFHVRIETLLELHI